MSKDLDKIPKNYDYHASWGLASYTHLKAYTHIYKDEKENVVLEIGDKNGVFRIISLTENEYSDLTREYPVHENGSPLLYHFGYWEDEEDE